MKEDNKGQQRTTSYWCPEERVLYLQQAKDKIFNIQKGFIIPSWHHSMVTIGTASNFKTQNMGIHENCMNLIPKFDSWAEVASKITFLLPRGREMYAGPSGMLCFCWIEVTCEVKVLISDNIPLCPLLTQCALTLSILSYLFIFCIFFAYFCLVFCESFEVIYPRIWVSWIFVNPSSFKVHAANPGIFG